MVEISRMKAVLIGRHRVISMILSSEKYVFEHYL